MRLYLTLKRRWWVTPYLMATCAFLWTVAWAMDEDDPRIDDFIERQSKFIAVHGFRVATIETDPGEVQVRAGGTRVRIQIWWNIEVGRTPLNSPIMEDRLWREVWAEMKARRGMEHHNEGNVFSLTHFEFVCRYLAVEGINSAMWIVFNGQKYDIKNILPDFERKDRVTIEARVQDIHAGLFPLKIILNENPPQYGAVGQGYIGFTPTGQGGTPPYQFSATGLPSGLTINASTGGVSGTPTEDGSFPVVITITDSEGKTENLPSLDIVVHPAP